jgi:hypothetical protein
MINLNKKYKTKGGNAVEIYKVNAGGNCPVIGAILNLKTNCWDCFRWDINGNSVFDTGSSFDLIEVPNFETLEYVRGYANTVNYFGMRVAVPSGILWLATDEDGTLFGYFAEPYICSAFGGESDFWDASTSANVKFAIINFNGDWKQSKIKVTTHD